MASEKTKFLKKAAGYDAEEASEGEDERPEEGIAYHEHLIKVLRTGTQAERNKLADECEKELETMKKGM